MHLTAKIRNKKPAILGSRIIFLKNVSTGVWLFHRGLRSEEKFHTTLTLSNEVGNPETTRANIFLHYFDLLSI